MHAAEDKAGLIRKLEFLRLLWSAESMTTIEVRLTITIHFRLVLPRSHLRSLHPISPRSRSRSPPSGEVFEVFAFFPFSLTWKLFTMHEIFKLSMFYCAFVGFKRVQLIFRVSTANRRMFPSKLMTTTPTRRISQAKSITSSLSCCRRFGTWLCLTPTLSAMVVCFWIRWDQDMETRNNVLRFVPSF